jgi:hypothetical protein
MDHQKTWECPPMSMQGAEKSPQNPNINPILPVKAFKIRAFDVFCISNNCLSDNFELIVLLKLSKTHGIPLNLLLSIP